ncbi:MAG: dehydrogenase [Acidobacteria bacterium]|nr:dehydrogenase [Acidobacteriota bacterium]
MITDLLRWPVVRQILHGGNGTGREAMSRETLALAPRSEGADVARSVCPYCGVGCAQLVFHRQGALVSIEGDPGSPISEGHLCPKGAASFELLTHAARQTRVKYRPPRGTTWIDMDPERALDLIAERVWDSRERHFCETHNGERVMQCASVAHLGGATLDNEENYLIKKLFTAGLGMVALSNQARI